MFDLLSYLTIRESIIYFYSKYTKNRLNKNCYNINYYKNRNSEFIYHYMNEYFLDDPILKNSTLAHKYYHIYYQNETIRPFKYFVNFREGYKNKEKLKPIEVNLHNINKLNINQFYTLDETIHHSKIEFFDKRNDLVPYINNLNLIKNKKLIASVFKHTNNYKDLSLKHRLKIILNHNIIEECYCLYCNKPNKIHQFKMFKHCGSKSCIKKYLSIKAVSRNSCKSMHTEQAKLNRVKSLIGRKLTQEHKDKIGLSNKNKWNDEFRIKNKEVRIKYNVNKRLSDTMKAKILAGEFTPKSENRKRAKRIKSDITGLNYRSNWELIFHEANPKLEYEKLRLSYMDGKTQRIYITDFVDFDNKIIYEIKPSSELNESNFLNKKKYTEEWCVKNKFLYKVVTEKDYNFYGRK